MLKIELKNQYDFLVLNLFCFFFFGSFFLLHILFDAGRRAGILLCRINRNMFCVFICWTLVSHIVSVELNAAHWSISLLWWKRKCSSSLSPNRALARSLTHSFIVYVWQSLWVSYCKNMNKFASKTDSTLLKWRWCFVETNHIDFPKTFKIKNNFPRLFCIHICILKYKNKCTHTESFLNSRWFVSIIRKLDC